MVTIHLHELCHSPCFRGCINKSKSADVSTQSISSGENLGLG